MTFVPHDQMTRRARWYLAIASTRHLLTAALAFTMPVAFTSPSFEPIREVAPLWLWAGMFATTGAACAWAGIRRSEAWARAALPLSGTITLIVAVGLLIASVADLVALPWLIFVGAIALKDFTVCADPLRSPFEQLAQQMEDDAHAHGERT